MGFWDKLGKTLEDSLDKSRMAYDKAKEYATVGSAHATILSWQSKRADLINKIGGIVYKKIVSEGKSSIKATEPDLKTVLDEITNLDQKIIDKQSELDHLKPPVSPIKSSQNNTPEK